MPKIFILPLFVALALCLTGCGRESSSSMPGGSTGTTTTGAANSSGTTGTTSGQNTNSGTTEGSGPHNAGIGGTSDTGNTNAVSHNTNREPPGVNKNGSGSATTNSQR